MAMVPTKSTNNSHPSQPSTSQNSQQSNKKPAPIDIVPFARAAKKHIELGQTFVTPSPWGGSIQADVPSYGFLSGVCVTINAAGGSGTATVTAKEDAPWSVIKNILFSDTNGAPIFNLDGYSAFLAMKYGGIFLFSVDGTTFAFSAVVTGANASGNFKIKVYIWQEFSRDGLGVLANGDASAKYHLNISLGAPADVYGVAPTNPPTLNTSIELLARSKPNQTDAFGKQQQVLPPSPGTIQYWTAQTFAVNNGQNTCQFNKVGNMIRNHILIFRATSDGTRATAESGGVVPGSIEFQWDAGDIVNCNVDTLRSNSYAITGIVPPNGVIPFLYTADTDSYAGAEYGDDWIPTVASTKLQIKFNSTAAGSLLVVTNDLVPGDGNIFAAPLMQIGGM
jgi:hypothetical protein